MSQLLFGFASECAQSPGKEEGGAYKCIIKNSAGEITANLNLNIEGGEAPKAVGEPPVFIEKPKITSEKGGKLIIMECRVKSKPKPDIVWHCEGKVVNESARIKQSVTADKDDVYIVRLELSTPELDDAGIYKCNVKNPVGETNANLTLNIEREFHCAMSEKRDASRTAANYSFFLAFCAPQWLL